MGDAVGVPGRWNNRVYGWNHQHPYSYVAPGEPSPREQDPRNAFSDIMGVARPTPTEPPSARVSPSRSRIQLTSRPRSSRQCLSS